MPSRVKRFDDIREKILLHGCMPRANPHLLAMNATLVVFQYYLFIECPPFIPPGIFKSHIASLTPANILCCGDFFPLIVSSLDQTYIIADTSRNVVKHQSIYNRVQSYSGRRLPYFTSSPSHFFIYR